VGLIRSELPHLSRLFATASSTAVGRGTALQAGRSRVRYPTGSSGIFHWLIPSSHTMALESTQPWNEYHGYLLWRKGGRCL